jgi:CRISPR system Cascade subunit CasC
MIMEFIALHLLTCYPVSCLSRDDMGSPKTAYFGGGPRARIPSQTTRAVIRPAMKAEMPESFQGIRTPQVQELLSREAEKQGHAPAAAATIAATLMKILTEGKKSKNPRGQRDEDVEELKPSNLMFFFSPQEITEMVAASNEPRLDLKSLMKRVKAPEALANAADIALFGRFLANASDLSLEGATCFSHALSTHLVEEEFDYFAAMEDCGGSRKSAVIMGTTAFNSATYYQCIVINLDLVSKHLPTLSRDRRLEILECFIRSSLTSSPTARHNSMFAANLPFFVLGLHQNKGCPVQLSNAFEKPIKASREGFNAASQRSLLDEHEKIKRIWQRKNDRPFEVMIPDCTLKQFMSSLLAQAWRPKDD